MEFSKTNVKMFEPQQKTATLHPNPKGRNVNKKFREQ